LFPQSIKKRSHFSADEDSDSEALLQGADRIDDASDEEE
jgi:hypothetical protein